MKFVEVASQARGRWHGILASLGVPPESLTPKHGPCPACGGKDRFRFDNLQDRGTFVCGRGGDPIAGDGFALVQHLLDCNPADALRAVSQVLGGNHEAIPLARPQRPPEPSRTQAYGIALWEQADRSDAAVASHPYAIRKGIDYHAGIGRVTASGRVIGRNADCLIAPVRSIATGELTAVEVINADGEKQDFGTVRGSAFRLGDPRDRAARWYVVEGIADAISVFVEKHRSVVFAAMGLGCFDHVIQQIKTHYQPPRLMVLEDGQ